MFVLYCRV